MTKFVQHCSSLFTKLALATTLLASIIPSVSADELGEHVPLSNRVEVNVGTSKLIKMRKKPERVVVSNPGIAYVVFVTPEEIEVIGRNPGRTNVYMWLTPPDDDPKAPVEVIGSEVVVGLPPPPDFKTTPTMEVVNGQQSELLYLGQPRDKFSNLKPGRVSDRATDMPEPCLSPGCI